MNDSISTIPKRFNPIKRRQILGLLLVVLLAEIVAALATSPRLKVHRLVLSGLGSLTPSEALKTQQIAEGLLRHNFFIEPISFTRHALHQLPWIKSVRIARYFPHRVTVHILPREPAFLLQTGKEVFETDINGVPIRPARGLFPHMLRVVLPPQPITCGLPVDDPDMPCVLTLLKRVGTQYHLPLVSIEVDRERNICLNMLGGMRVLLGQTEEMERKVALLQSIFIIQPDVAQRLSVVNLTCPSYPACIPRVALLKTPASTGTSQLLLEKSFAQQKVPNKMSHTFKSKTSFARSMGQG